MNVQQLRSDTPGCRERIHLNNAGAALMPEPVIRTIHDHLALESRIGGYEAAEACQAAIEDAYQAVARLVGAPARNIAFTENATAATMQALSSIPFVRDDVILTTRNDYVSNQIQYLALGARLGVRVVRAPDLPVPGGGVDVQAMAELIERHHPRLVAVTHIPTNSGLVQDVAAVGAVCRQEGITYLVDACQSVGQTPIDVTELGCDFLAASARKFLRGPRGVGFLYVSDRGLDQGFEPLFIDMRGAEWIAPDRYRAASDATRFENWESPWALVRATGEAARYAADIGLPAISDRVRALARRLRESFAPDGTIRVLDRGAELSAIVSLAVDGWDPVDLVGALRERHVNTSAQHRAYAVIDCDTKGVTTSLRLSPHYYNTEDEIDQAVAVLHELVPRRGRGR